MLRRKRQRLQNPVSYVIISITALVASLLTLFSGFGLGTILLPAFAIFFPIETAVALTAVVHLLNNLFKFALVGRKADYSVVLRFGLPALLAAFAGAWVLTRLTEFAPFFTYHALGAQRRVLPVNVVIATLMIFFALLEMAPSNNRRTVPRRFMPIGGVLSGFVGGLSGHQGALRSAFLVRADLGKEAFIATGVVIACMVDVARLTVYAADFSLDAIRENGGLLVAATLAAFAGAFVGARLMKKVTIRQVQIIVAIMLLLLALGIGSGFI